MISCAKGMAKYVEYVYVGGVGRCKVAIFKCGNCGDETSPLKALMNSIKLCERDHHDNT